MTMHNEDKTEEGDLGACKMCGQEIPAKLIHRIASITHLLRSSLRDLGLDGAIQKASEAIPDAQERLRYINRMTEQASNQVLSLSERNRPLQRALVKEAQSLQSLWAEGSGNDALRQRTIAFLSQAQETGEMAHNDFMEIIMAQDFQDLTGQVVKKMMALFNTLEKELFEVLMEHTEQAKSVKSNDSMLNGPQIQEHKGNDAVSDQGQVDDLLASLGF